MHHRLSIRLRGSGLRWGRKDTPSLEALLVRQRFPKKSILLTPPPSQYGIKIRVTTR